MNAASIITLIGGLALFLYGVTLMGEGMKLLAGSRLESFINTITGSPIKAIGVGAGMAAVIQSSSATSIMAMGFVNTSLIRIKQAIYMILGAILGTSITAWLACLSAGNSDSYINIIPTSAITGAVAILGIILRKFTKSKTKIIAGDILLGFSVLLVGMSTMTSSLSPLTNNVSFMNTITAFSNPFLGVLAGILIAFILQSSSAATALLQALAITGSLTFSIAFPIVLGIVIGSALPVLIGSIGVSINGRRTAVSHLLIAVFGALFCGIVFYIINAVHHFEFTDSCLDIFGVALLTTVFRLIIVIISSPFAGKIEALSCRIVKDKAPAEDDMNAGDLAMLEDRFLSHTAVAIAQSRRVVDSMAILVQKNFSDADSVLESYSPELFNEVAETEDLVDKYEDKLGSYLIRISDKELSKGQNEELYKFLHAITDLERISDHSLNIAESAQEITKQNITFSEAALAELKVLRSAVSEIIDITVKGFINDDLEAASRVEPLEELIDNLCDELKHNHIDRLQNDACTLEHGFIFNDLLTNFERIGDHCSNIAVAMLEINNDQFDTHEYIDSLVNLKNEKFSQYYEEFKKKYSL